MKFKISMLLYMIPLKILSTYRYCWVLNGFGYNFLYKFVWVYMSMNESLLVWTNMYESVIVWTSL